jgi:hypothetical protein
MEIISNPLGGLIGRPTPAVRIRSTIPIQTTVRKLTYAAYRYEDHCNAHSEIIIITNK